MPLELVGNRAAAPLALLAGAADRWTDFDDRAVSGLFVPSGPGPAARFGPLVAAVAWCADPDGVLAANLARLTAAESDRVAGPPMSGPLRAGSVEPPPVRTVVVPSRPPEGSSVHVADHLLGSLRPLGVEPERGAPPLRFVFPPPVADAALQYLTDVGQRGGRFVAVHPGSGSARKNWPAEALAALLDQLPAALGARPLLLGGPADDDTLARLLGRGQARPPLLRGLPLDVLAAVLQHAAAYLGNDSGPTHLAAMLGMPTLALFGPTDPATWAPRGPRVRVLRHEPLAELRPEVVLAALGDLLP